MTPGPFLVPLLRVAPGRFILFMEHAKFLQGEATKEKPVATGLIGSHFHRNHRGPGTHPVAPG